MKSSLFLCLVTLISISCSAKKDIYQELSDLKALKEEKLPEKYLSKTLELKKEYPDSILAQMSFLSARSESPLVQLEIAAISKRNKILGHYLKERVRVFELGYSGGDISKKNKIFTDLKGYIEKNKALQVEGYYDLSHMIYDREKVKSVLRPLMKLRPNKSLFKEEYAALLKGKKNSVEIIELCKSALSMEPVNFVLCYGLYSLKNIESVKKEYSKLSPRLDKVIEELSVKEDLEKAFRLLSRNQLKDKANELAQKILKIDKDWLPANYYRSYLGLKNFSQYLEFKEFSEATRSTDPAEKVRKLKDMGKNLKLPKVIRYFALTTLASHFENPAFKDERKAMSYNLEAFNLTDEYYGAGLDYLELALEKKNHPTNVMDVADRVEMIIGISIKKSFYNTTPERDVENAERDLSLIMLYKGKIFKKRKEFDKARNAFTASYALGDSVRAAYELGLLEEEKNSLLALDWLLKSTVNEKDSFSKEEKKIREDKVSSLLKESFGRKFDHSEMTAIYKEESNTKEEEKEEDHALIGKKFPTIDLRTPSGKNYDWSKLKGKNVVISFWATWCTPCFQEMAVLNKMVKEKKLKNLKVVGICTDGIDNKKKVQKIIKKSKIAYDIVLSDGSMKSKYDVAAIPSNFFIGKDGKVLDNEIGYSPKLEELILEKF